MDVESVAVLAFNDDDDDDKAVGTVRAVGTNPLTTAMGATRTSNPMATSRRAGVDEV